MNEAEVVEGIAHGAHDQPTEVAQPGAEPLNLPAAPVPTHRIGAGACFTGQSRSSLTRASREVNCQAMPCGVALFAFRIRHDW